MIKKEEVHGIKYDTPDEVNFEFISEGIQALCLIAVIVMLGIFIYQNITFVG